MTTQWPRRSCLSWGFSISYHARPILLTRPLSVLRTITQRIGACVRGFGIIPIQLKTVTWVLAYPKSQVDLATVQLRMHAYLNGSTRISAIPILPFGNQN